MVESKPFPISFCMADGRTFETSTIAEHFQKYVEEHYPGVKVGRPEIINCPGNRRYAVQFYLPGVKMKLPFEKFLKGVESD